MRVCPLPGDELSVPAKQGRRGDEERRPPWTWQSPGQGCKHHPVGRFEVGAVYLPAQHRDLVAQYQEFDVFGSAVAGELGQHLQHLAQKQVHQRSAHGPGSLQLPRRRPGPDPHVNRLNPIYEPDTTTTEPDDPLPREPDGVTDAEPAELDLT
jgi:hypothetical protein